MTKETIDITPSWRNCGEIIIMTLQNAKLSKEGYEQVFYNIRDMARKLDEANALIKQLKGGNNESV